MTCVSRETLAKIPEHPFLMGTSNPFKTLELVNSNCTLPKTESLVTYGELVVLGYNDRKLHGETDRRRSKFILQKRPVPNGVKKSQHYVIFSSPRTSRAVSSSRQHSVAYSITRKETVIAEYVPDDTTDLFQIGRSTEDPIDFVVMDTKFRDKKEIEITESTISRFACRILIERSGDFRARVYAAGFDSMRNIFLGEDAIKWQRDGEIDGLTTNGIHIMHPPGPFSDGAGPGVWREVSVSGDVYELKEHRKSKNAAKVNDVTNVLQDGTLIDIIGATLLWRSAEGLRNSPTKEQLKEKIDKFNAVRFMCPVKLNSLRIPMNSGDLTNEGQPYVYLVCGHVQGLHGWGKKFASNSHTCPLCRSVGPIAKLTVGFEPSCYVDYEPPTYAFNPCGHMASEKTVKYWASIPIPTKCFHAACPFCATPLLGDTSYVKLIFQDNIF